MRNKAVAVLMTLVAVLSIASAVSASGAGGVVGAAFYVGGDQYQTVLTPTDLSNTKAPSHTFDKIYVIVANDESGNAIYQLPVAEAALATTTTTAVAGRPILSASQTTVPRSLFSTAIVAVISTAPKKLKLLSPAVLVSISA